MKKVVTPKKVVTASEEGGDSEDSGVGAVKSLKKVVTASEEGGDS